MTDPSPSAIVLPHHPTTTTLMISSSKTPRAKSHSALPCHTTYAKAQGVRPYDWNKALREVKPTQTANLNAMRQRASQWVTCACGNLCQLIPRYDNGGRFPLFEPMQGEPRDPRLSKLGYAFNQYVRDLKDGAESKVKAARFNALRRRAQGCLAQIEARSEVLIRGILREAARAE